MENKQLGLRIKAAREAKKIKLKVMADLLGVGISTYSSREGRGDFEDQDFAKVLKKLGLTRDQLQVYELPAGSLPEIALAEALISIEAKSDIILSVLAELLSKQTGQSATGALNDLTRAVRVKYEQMRAEAVK